MAQFKYISDDEYDKFERILRKYFARRSPKDGQPFVFYGKEDLDNIDRVILDGARNIFYESVKESVSIDVMQKLEDDGWTVLSRGIRGNDSNHYWLARKMNKDLGKAEWKAINDITGEVIDITYEQALGREPIGDKPIAELSKKLGKILLPRYSKDESLNESGRPMNRRERTSYITKLVKALMAEPYNYDHETANDIATMRADRIDRRGYYPEYDGSIEDLVDQELRFVITKAKHDARIKKNTKALDEGKRGFVRNYIEESVDDDDDRPLRVCRQCLMGIEAHEGKQRAKHIYIDDEDFYDDHDEYVKDSTCDWCGEYGFDELWEI